MTGFSLLGVILVIVLIAIVVAAVWLTTVVLNEAHEIKRAVKDVQCAFGNIEIEINKRLLIHNALHYSELLKIIKIVGDMVPGVEININREFESNRVHILVELDGVKSKFTFVGAVVEYGIPKLQDGYQEVVNK